MMSPGERSARCAHLPRCVEAGLTLQIDWLLLPVLTFMYLTCSLDKSNLGNAKTLGMIKDIGKDPRGNKYALLQAMYFITYAPFGQSQAL